MSYVVIFMCGFAAGGYYFASEVQIAQIKGRIVAKWHDLFRK